MLAINSLAGLPGTWLIGVAVLLTILAIAFFFRDKERAALVALFFSSFFLRLYFAYLDPFLHTWDEKFHALVARNMMHEPFKPMLRVMPLVDYDKFSWCCNHIWLHKQPLFLWQMALSMKLFGVSEFSIRYPSVLMGVIMSLLVYSITKTVTGNKVTAFIAALLLCWSNYQLELVSGYLPTDHNDTAFCFYALLSLWAYMRYLKSAKWSDVLLIGLFAGCAVLNKWLTGMLVFAVWGVNILLSIKATERRREMIHFIVAALVSVAVFVPWQLYILHAFPEEARYEYAYNARHITEAIEDHKGSILFYIGKLPLYFGGILWVLIPAGMFLLIKQIRNKYSDKKAAVAVLSGFSIVFLFFSLVVKTKWPPLLVVVTPLGFVFIAIAMQWLFSLFKAQMAGARVAVLFLLCLLILDLPKVLSAHRPDDKERLDKAYNAAVYKSIKGSIPANISLVLNVDSFEDTDAMFYNDGLNIYSWFLNDHCIDSLANQGVRIAVFKSHSVYTVPPKIVSYPGVFIIDKELR